MTVRGWGMAAGVSFALAVVLAIVGKILESRGLGTPAVRTAFIAAAVAAFVVICTSIPPLALRYFLAGQVAIGNGEVPVIAFMLRHETNIVRGIWVFMAAGAAIMLPQVLRDLGWKV
jgi:ABC-type proline/glycine betaine transport system permease subunit